MKCKRCGASLDLTQSACAACGAELELGRLTGILGVVCRACDAYNEPGARTCIACGKPVGAAAEPSPAPTATSSPAPSPEPVNEPEPEPGPGPDGPVIRSFARAGAPTRFVPVVRPASAESPALTPIPLVSGGTRIFTRAAAPAIASAQIVPGRARLVLERGAGVEGSSYSLATDAVQAGRGGAVAFPDDPCLSPVQATFFTRGGALYVRDEGAPGGVLLKLRGLSAPLRPGDLFAVGSRLLRFAGPLPPAAAPPPDGTRRLGAPRPPAPAIVIEEWLEGGVQGRVFVRTGPAITIGRAGCAIDLGDDPDLSPAHAEIRVELNGAAKLRDLGSSTGTFVRIPSRAERELRDGDCVRLGREILRVAA
ncbi:MAG TPA: FHA domain-containing protein [Anaeromyxobacteraceae bacterium]|nr:FHA domain-containing protein [Anaeromyxobacteraceae bacterium]